MLAARIAGEAVALRGARAPLSSPCPARRSRTPRLTPRPDPSLSRVEHFGLYTRGLFLPWCRRGNSIVVACAGDPGSIRALLTQQFGRSVECVRVEKQTLIDALQCRFRSPLKHDARFALDALQPKLSARHVASTGQKRAALLLLIFAGVAALVAPEAATTGCMLLAAALYASNIVTRVVLYIAGWSGAHVRCTTARSLAECDETRLPTYTILVPLYREAHMLPQVVGALRRLSYPPKKLDIKIILEEGDEPTITAAQRLRLDDRFGVLIVPDATLHTKPRACNYALRFARGEHIVIYDAEDRPEPDQLKKSALAFAAAPDVACLQARLAFYNSDDNWLSRMFEVEYRAWFGIMLPGLARLGIPIPLGGTSNHFRTDVLRAIGGWDAYNVTEDADAGFRLARAGYRTAPLDSTTHEEANARVAPWVRQRSRWLKGYMQTVLVHARAPQQFIRQIGVARYLVALLFVGGAAASALVAPLLWIIGAVWAFVGHGPQSEFLEILSFAGFVVGNALLTALAMAGAQKTAPKFTSIASTACAYSFLMSLGAYKALGQLVSGRSSFWEKTEHGIARVTHRRIRLAARPAFASAALVLLLLVVSACAAFANPWLKSEGGGEVTVTARAMQSFDGFAADPASNGAIDLHAEYGVTDRVTFVFDSEAKEDGDIAGSHLQFAGAGARVALGRWDTGVISFQAELGASALREDDGQPFFGNMHGAGEARLLLGQDFELFGDHAWVAAEAGYRWRAGPPADEAILDFTLGVQPRDDLFFMLQSFGMDTIDEPFGGYRAFKSDKLQLTAAYEIAPQIWVQTGGIASVYGDDSGNAGGIVALWWRF